jgi:nicotinamidase-related amidase
MAFSEEAVLAAARAAYRDGKATLPVHTDRTALLVIDMQDEFVRPNWSPYWVPGATRLAPRLARLVDHCRTRAVPVIYTVFAETHHRLDRPRALRHMPNVAAGWTPPPTAAQVWHEVAPQPGDLVIQKPSYGAFYDTPLDTILRGLGRDTVVVTGTLTNFCCGMTARQAYERGYHVVVASDLTATDDPDQQEPELATLRRGFALVLTADEITARLT